MKKILIAILFFPVISGAALTVYAGPAEFVKGFFAVSTRELEELRGKALVKIFEESHADCFDRIKGIIKKMPGTTIYAETKDMIAVYCVCLNGTPAGIFFTAVDPTHTKVEISSASSRAKDWVASNIFSGKIQPPITRFEI